MIRPHPSLKKLGNVSSKSWETWKWLMTHRLERLENDSSESRETWKKSYSSLWRLENDLSKKNRLNEWILIATWKNCVVHSDRPNHAYLNPLIQVLRDLKMTYPILERRENDSSRCGAKSSSLHAPPACSIVLPMFGLLVFVGSVHSTRMLTRPFGRRPRLPRCSRPTSHFRGCRWSCTEGRWKHIGPLMAKSPCPWCSNSCPSSTKKMTKNMRWRGGRSSNKVALLQLSMGMMSWT